MYKIGLVTLALILCTTYFVISSKAPNQSEISKGLALEEAKEASSTWFDFQKVQNFTLTSYRYFQSKFILLYEGEYQLAWNETVEDFISLKDSIEKFIRNIDWFKLAQSVREFLALKELNDFEYRLCREFCLILAGNTVLVLIAWKIYGPRISAKFGPSKGSRKTVEEIRMSISEFHLPKEHDFKFK